MTNWDSNEERRGNWDTDLDTNTTPDSAIDNWGRPAAEEPDGDSAESDAPEPSETGDK